MILTNCAACAAPLPRPAKQCSRCKTLYCGPACQMQHWERGGHDALCKKIKKGGGAEQYHADKKCKEAVAVAVEACADDTKGQTCYICLEAVHSQTGEGLVRGCGCQGATAYAHISCLVRHMHGWDEIDTDNKMKGFLEPGTNRRDDADKLEYLQTFLSCKLCKRNYTDVVVQAIGWGIWKMHASKPEGPLYANSLMYLALSMKKAGRSKEAVEVIKAAARAKGLNPDTSIFPGMVARRAAALAAGELGK